MSEPGEITRPGGFVSQIPFEGLAGLRPRAWLCVGSGFSREDIKAQLLERGYGFTGESISSLQAIAVKIVGAVTEGFSGASVLGGLARQEVLRILMGNPRISAALPELRRLKRQSGFFKKLDGALQAGRLTFAHADEGAVYAERLNQRLGQNQVRDEVQRLSLAYEAWLEGSALLDPPMLLSRASQILQEQGWPERLSKPDRIAVFSGQLIEGRERAFWDAVSGHVPVAYVGPLEGGTPQVAEGAQPWDWQLWHTLDDAADELASVLASEEAASSYKDCALLIPDTPGVRRALGRALERRGVPLADPRDPTRMRWDEAIKWAIAPIKTVARGFERQDVVAYLSGFYRGPQLSAWLGEIHSRGLRRGLTSYSGGRLAPVTDLLTALDEALGGRLSCAELGAAHVGFLRAEMSGHSEELGWLLPFFEAFWKAFAADMARVGLGDRKAPTLYWWERLQPRLAETSPPVERLKPETGLLVYRLQQAPVAAPQRLYVLGMPPGWLSGEGLGDYWFSERERETLCAEFSVRSGITLRQERLASLQAWVAGVQKITWLDAAYDVDGRERESIDSALREIAQSLDLPEGTVPEHPREMGAHSSRIQSFGALRPLPAMSLALQPLALGPGGAPPEITATALDSYSRCGLQALAYHRWKLRDLKRPDTDLWPEARGNILHAAVKILLESRAEDGTFGVGAAQALDQAWKLEAPRGLLRSARTERYVRARMEAVLTAFLEKEREYFTRAPSKIASLDSAYFSLKYDDVSIVGMPDRIDEHPEGLFVLDYKTSSSLPSGTDMLEGYRLQLPFYALAAQRELHKPVLGVQFVELNRKGGRGAGIFFKRYNGKEQGKLTTLTARSKSLLNLEPEEAWGRLEESIHEHARALVSGRFDAYPKKEKECTSCSVSDLCGLKRLTERLPREAFVVPSVPATESVPGPASDPALPERERPLRELPPEEVTP